MGQVGRRARPIWVGETLTETLREAARLADMPESSLADCLRHGREVTTPSGLRIAETPPRSIREALRRASLADDPGDDDLEYVDGESEAAGPPDMRPPVSGEEVVRRITRAPGWARGWGPILRDIG